MKSYNHLYEICLSERIRAGAIKKIKHSKRVRNYIRKHNMTDEFLLNESYAWLSDYKVTNHHVKTIYDGITHKKREIIVPTVQELFVQHCIVDTLKPLFYQGMYFHSYASTPKKGAHKGKKYIEKWIHNDKFNTQYILKIDIRHFFASIPIKILKNKFIKYIHDDRMLELIFDVLDTNFDGIPLGYYSSQWISNWYLQGLDHYIVETLHAAHYIRYADDMVIFAPDKQTLHFILNHIINYLHFNLGLEINRKWQIFPIKDKCKGRELDFMGFKFSRDFTILRRSIMLKATRKAKKISKSKRLTLFESRQMISYTGWLKCTSTHNMYIKWIKPYVNIGKLKKHISFLSRYDPQCRYMKLVSLYT